MFNQWRLLLLLLLCGTILISCADNSSQQESQTESAVSDLQAKTPVYALVTKDKDNPYMQKMEEGFKSACAELGAEAICLGPSDYSAQEQIDLVEHLIDLNVGTVAIAVNDADVLQAALQKAMEKGIGVVSLDSAANAESRMLHIQQADPEKVGRVLIQAAAHMIDNQGTIGVITTTGQATNQNLWIEWLKQEVEDYPEKYKDIRLLSEVYGNDDYEMTVTQTLYLLNEYPDLDIIITPSVVSMAAVGHTLREQNSKVLFTGLGLPSEIADYIEFDKSCPWFYLWNPIDLGYLSAYASYALDGGEIAGEVGDSFMAGSLGRRVVVPSSDGGTEALLGDPMKFDKDNIALWRIVY